MEKIMENMHTDVRLYRVNTLRGPFVFVLRSWIIIKMSLACDVRAARCGCSPQVSF